MAVEIERKYLVNKEFWEKIKKETGNYYRQGYISTDPSKTIRVRLTDHSGFLTVKGLSVGATRLEYEYPIPKEDAAELLDNFCSSTLSKIRYKVYHEEKLWEVDEFLENNEGLILAEIELTSEQEHFAVPAWVDKEVTGEEKYYNSYLSTYPFKTWVGVEQ